MQIRKENMQLDEIIKQLNKGPLVCMYKVTRIFDHINLYQPYNISSFKITLITS